MHDHIVGSNKDMGSNEDQFKVIDSSNLTPHKKQARKTEKLCGVPRSHLESYLTVLRTGRSSPRLL